VGNRTGSEIVADLPQTAGAAREDAILTIIRAGEFLPIVWSEVQLQLGSHHATLFVSSDALALGRDDDAIRITVTATTTQRIADAFGTVLPTTRICDLVWSQALVRLTPCLQTPDAHMSDTDRMVRHSREVDAKRAGRAGLVENVGKHWVLTNGLESAPGRAANYGWFDPQAMNGRLWQTLGLAHSAQYVDYSQVVRLVRRDIIVDGVVRDIEEIGRDAELSALVSSEGPLRVWRLPGVDPSPQTIPWRTNGEPPPESPPTAFRALARGMRGDDVAAWERQLIHDGHSLGPWGADGVFGNATHNATVAWQAAHGLPATGIVDAATMAAAVTTPVVPVPTEAPIAFVEARNFTHANRTAVDWIVLHSMEAPESATTAEDVARWFAGPNAPRASAHYCVDVDSIVQCVRDEDVAWHAPGANSKGIGIEHAGYARQSFEEWRDAYSSTMLARSAALVARLCRKWNIPAEFVDRNGLLAGTRGITTHNEVTWAFHESTHTDPGPYFPIEDYVRDVRTRLASV
jgi:N-acetyl-anhydromuramyl-L-alanine amidase AmpD